MKNAILSIAVLLSAALIGVMSYFEVPWYATVLVLLMLAFAWVFYILVLPKLMAARDALGVSQVSAALHQDGKQGSAWWLWLTGFKTQAALFLSVMSEAVPQLVYKLEGYDMTNALGPKLGSIASLIFMGAAAWFHANGLVKAANTTPPGASQ